MRLDKAAQPEVRNLTNDLFDVFKDYDKNILTMYNMIDVETPYYKIEDNIRNTSDSEIDEVISEEEVK